jgi:acetyl esterase/lipase
MNRSEILFKTLDLICHPLQNINKYEDITVLRDIIYNDSYPDDCTLNFHYKKGAQSYPVMLNIHGGGFVAGDKKHRESFCNYMADKGWFVANINYRLGPKYAFPAGVQDAVAALTFLEKIKDKYNLDVDKTVVTGDSAGGYYTAQTYAALYDASLGEKLNVTKPGFNIAGLLLFCGAYDIEVAIKRKMPFGFTRSIGESFLGIKLNKDFSNLQEYEYMPYLSPANFVGEGWCPCFLVYSDKDFFVAGMAENLIEKLKEYNVPYQTYNTTKFGDNHCFHLFTYKKEAKKCMDAILPWLEEIKSR